MRKIIKLGLLGWVRGIVFSRVIKVGFIGKMIFEHLSTVLRCWHILLPFGDTDISLNFT